MKSWLRQHQYALGITVRRLIAQPFSTLTNILVVALALTIPLVGAATLVSIQPVTAHVATGPQVTLFLTTTAPAGVASEIAQRVRQQHAEDVGAVTVIPRDEALARLRSHPGWSEAFDVLGQNPLPDAVLVELRGSDFVTRADRLVASWRSWPHVEHVQLDSEWVQRLHALMRLARMGLLLLAVGVALVVLATVFNTVRMQALTQREEITVARLLGATESFVRRPFLYLGALIGGVASFIAIGLGALVLSYLNTAASALARSYGVEFYLHLPPTSWLLTFVLGVVLLAAFSALWSVTRNTRF